MAFEYDTSAFVAASLGKKRGFQGFVFAQILIWDKFIEFARKFIGKFMVEFISDLAWDLGLFNYKVLARARRYNAKGLDILFVDVIFSHFMVENIVQL